MGDRDMKKKLILVIGLALAWASLAHAAEITDIAWNESNIQILHGYDKSSVEKLINDLRGGDLLHAMVGGFGWYDLAGDKRYHLVATEDLSGRAYFDYLAIYQQDSSGKPVLQQWIEGDRIGTDMGKVVRDLNGDGEHELVIPMELPPGNWSPAAMTPVWPAIYRLKNGKFVEASKEFATFYDTQVLPRLDKQISQGEATRIEELDGQYAVALLVLTKDHILHILGRELTTDELDQARAANEEINNHAERVRNGAR
jgi:hypothetical protein